MRHAAALRVPNAPVEVVSLDELIASDSGQPLPVDLSLYDRAARPSEILERRQALSALVGFLVTLSERERVILERHYWQGEMQTAIAVDFGVSKMAISKSVKRVLERARQAMAGHEPTMGKKRSRGIRTLHVR